MNGFVDILRASQNPLIKRTSVLQQWDNWQFVYTTDGEYERTKNTLEQRANNSPKRGDDNDDMDDEKKAYFTTLEKKKKRRKKIRKWAPREDVQNMGILDNSNVKSGTKFRRKESLATYLSDRGQNRTVPCSLVNRPQRMPDRTADSVQCLASEKHEIKKAKKAITENKKKKRVKLQWDTVARRLIPTSLIYTF